MVQWDVATGKRLRTWRGHLGPILNEGAAVAFTADGGAVCKYLSPDEVLCLIVSEFARGRVQIGVLG